MSASQHQLNRIQGFCAGAHDLPKIKKVRVSGFTGAKLATGLVIPSNAVIDLVYIDVITAEETAGDVKLDIGTSSNTDKFTATALGAGSTGLQLTDVVAPSVAYGGEEVYMQAETPATDWEDLVVDIYVKYL